MGFFQVCPQVLLCVDEKADSRDSEACAEIDKQPPKPPQTPFYDEDALREPIVLGGTRVIPWTIEAGNDPAVLPCWSDALWKANGGTPNDSGWAMGDAKGVNEEEQRDLAKNYLATGDPSRFQFAFDSRSWFFCKKIAPQ